MACLLFSLVALRSFGQETQPTSLSVEEPKKVLGAIQDTSITPGVSATLAQGDAATTHLDNAVAALNKGDKATSTQELQTGIAGLEAQAKTDKTSFKDKLLAQASKLKALLPLIPDGALGNGVLGKAVSLAKLASGGSKLEGLLAAGSLLGKGSQLTSGLSGIGSALSGLGGGTQSSGQSLITKALSTVGKLNQGGLVAKAAEPVVKTEVSSLLNLIKGAL
ncbi:hypothetical protein IC229_17670 [Spirosoma sp. BT702]|uniref:Uncharacterized protein n=2 Tax=Spirosoma profusum TaxID=2771354 RepID=A0A926XYI0_9BACT|nr:hypothetical protein [Spirosoma profusum]